MRAPAGVASPVTTPIRPTTTATHGNIMAKNPKPNATASCAWLRLSCRRAPSISSPRKSFDVSEDASAQEPLPSVEPPPLALVPRLVLTVVHTLRCSLADAVAVTVAWTEVVRVVTAVPAASVVTAVAPSVPAVVVKTTGTAPNRESSARFDALRVMP